VNYVFFGGEVWAHKYSLTPPLFIEVPVPSQILLFIFAIFR